MVASITPCRFETLSNVLEGYESMREHSYMKSLVTFGTPT